MGGCCTTRLQLETADVFAFSFDEDSVFYCQENLAAVYANLRAYNLVPLTNNWVVQQPHGFCVMWADEQRLNCIFSIWQDIFIQG